MQHRRRIGQAGRLDHRAGEIGHPPLDPVDEQIGQRVDDVAAHRAAQAAAVQQYDILGRAFDQQVVEADLAEFVDDDSGRRHAGLLQHVVQNGRLAAAEKPGQHRHRDTRSGLNCRHFRVFPFMTARPTLPRFGGSVESGCALCRYGSHSNNRPGN